MKYEVTINNYQKGAQLKTAMPDHVILLEKIDRNHHRVVYELRANAIASSSRRCSRGSSAPSTEGGGSDHLAVPQAEDPLIPAAPEGKRDILLLQQERAVHQHINVFED